MIIQGTIAGASLVLGGSYAYNYYKRNEYLETPVMRRALKVIKSDKRVLDYCGDNLQVGWSLKEKKKSAESQSFHFQMKGSAGSLDTVVVADAVEHSNLQYFDNEIGEHLKKKEAKDEKYNASDFEKEWPLDLEEYNILSVETNKYLDENKENKEVLESEIKPDEKIWRIKTLRVSVDEDSRILLLPLPKSKRTKELWEARYTHSTYNDLLRYVNEDPESTMLPSNKRYEDLTEEEM